MLQQITKYYLKGIAYHVTIIPLLLTHIQELNNQILFLFNFIVKNIPLKFKEKDDSLLSQKYNKLKVDKLPIVHVPEKKGYKQLLKQYLEDRGKPIKPIKSRCDKSVPDDIHCPLCGGTIILEKNRKLFNIHTCCNENCSYYKNSLSFLSETDLEEYKTNPEKFKLHYIYSEFKIFCLTYLLNCVLSTRNPRNVMREVPGIKISHTQIANYNTDLLTNYLSIPLKFLAVEVVFSCHFFVYF